MPPCPLEWSGHCECLTRAGCCPSRPPLKGQGHCGCLTRAACCPYPLAPPPPPPPFATTLCPHNISNPALDLDRKSHRQTSKLRVTRALRCNTQTRLLDDFFPRALCDQFGHRRVRCTSNAQANRSKPRLPGMRALYLAGLSGGAHACTRLQDED